MRMADDRINAPSKRDGVLSATPIFAKIVELIFSIVAVGLIVDPFNASSRDKQPIIKLNDIAFVYVTLAGYIVFNTIAILSHFLGDRMPKRMAYLYTGVGAILHIAAGSVIINNWRKSGGSYVLIKNNNALSSKQYKDMMVASGVITFLDAGVFILDFLLTYKFT